MIALYLLTTTFKCLKGNRCEGTFRFADLGINKGAWLGVHCDRCSFRERDLLAATCPLPTDPRTNN